MRVYMLVISKYVSTTVYLINTRTHNAHKNTYTTHTVYFLQIHICVYACVCVCVCVCMYYIHICTCVQETCSNVFSESFISISCPFPVDFQEKKICHVQALFQSCQIIFYHTYIYLLVILVR